MKIFTFVFATCFTLLLLWMMGWLWFATTIAMTEPQSGDTETDAIIVVTGGNGRINEGLDLLDDSKSTKLFISGVNNQTEKKDIFKSWKRGQEKSSDKPCCVYLGYEAKDTQGNAVEVSQWIQKNDIKTIRLVTSSYHMPRAQYMISRLVPDVKVIEHPVFSDDFKSWEGRFWSLTFSEYNKFLVSLIIPDALASNENQ